jgi:hypothetical protein
MLTDAQRALHIGHAIGVPEHQLPVVPRPIVTAQVGAMSCDAMGTKRDAA